MKSSGSARFARNCFTMSTFTFDKIDDWFLYSYYRYLLFNGSFVTISVANTG